MRFPLCQTMAVARYIRKQKKLGVTRFPLVLMLEPLYACNLSCSGCGRIREYKDRLSEVLSVDDCMRAISDCGAPVVSICGGEPLLHPNISDIVDGALRLGRVVYLCTNGQTLDKKLHVFKPHRMFNINVHVDGTRKTHDAIVERIGAFDRAISGIRAAKRAGFTVCTNTTVYSQSSEKDVRDISLELTATGIDGMLISPGFDYTDVKERSVFLTRESIIEKFKNLDDVVRGKNIWNTPIFYDFLQGRRALRCTPWGNVTFNVCGWKAPCYLVTDGHYPSYGDFMDNVDWEKYGPGRDPRCANCMAHCGFEATAALAASSSIRDGLRMARWTFF